MLPLAACGRLGPEPRRVNPPPPQAAAPGETAPVLPVTSQPLAPIGSQPVAPAPQPGTPPASQPMAPEAALPAGSPPGPGALGGALGARLTEADRQAAVNAQYEAVSSGQKKSWKGANGTFGFTDPGQASGSCRTYTDTVYIDGRPQSGRGQACQGADGTWQITN
ncbi:hypothetical protein DYH55_20995 [Methylovirgula sp. 4M-Z18]|nr:hypothetical protein DYH55_20995 [Methylovirgula sp. 4M-Z18]